jgi:hypothetical protein
MSEQPDQSRPRADEDEDRRAGAGTDAGARDAGGRGSVRTTGETSVDEAVGAGDEPTR